MLLLLSGCGSRKIPCEKTEHTIFAMDTYITLTAYGKGAKEAVAAAEYRIYELEALFSVTDEKSEIYALNHSMGQPVKVSAETVEILEFALEIAQKTDGALDPTIYPVLRAWGFTTGRHQVPSQSEINRLLPLVGYEKVRISEDEILLPQGMQIDLGAVVKGYAGDVVAELLKKQEVFSAIINLGGNVQAVGAKLDGSAWRIGVKAPNTNDNFGVLEVTDLAVVTSGGYERYFAGEDGEIYWHILDPSSGKPAHSGIISVTVAAKEGRYCDGLSTAVFVMGVEQAANFWRENKDFEMLLLTEDNKIYITKGLESAFTLTEAYASYPVTVIEP